LPLLNSPCWPERNCFVVQTALHLRGAVGTNVLAISGEQAVFVKRKIERDLSDK